MPETTIQGHYDSQGNACLTFLLIGSKSAITLDAIIDTGFTGFVQTSPEVGASIGLPDLKRVTPVTLADGSTISCEFSVSIARFMGMGKPGTVLMPAGSHATLVGMEFLRTFGVGLMISRSTGVHLVSEHLLSEALEQARSADTKEIDES